MSAPGSPADGGDGTQPALDPSVVLGQLATAVAQLAQSAQMQARPSSWTESKYVKAPEVLPQRVLTKSWHSGRNGVSRLSSGFTSKMRASGMTLSRQRVLIASWPLRTMKLRPRLEASVCMQFLQRISRGDPFASCVRSRMETGLGFGEPWRMNASL